MQYNPDDYEPMDFAPIVPGKYEFVVVAADEAQSKNGNDMISLSLQVTVPDRDNGVKVYDYLVSTAKALFKIEQFCKATGIDFNSGNLEAEDCLGLEGVALFRLGEKKSDGKQYLEVDRYLPLEGYTEQPVGKKVSKPVGKTTKTTKTVSKPMARKTVVAGPSNFDEQDDEQPIDYPDDDIPF